MIIQPAADWPVEVMMRGIGINILVALMGMASRKFHEVRADSMAETRDQAVEIFSNRLRCHSAL
jgi:hypothetical protein